MKWLPKCVANTGPYPVIIVDNNSTDATISFIEENYPKAVLLKQKNNLGFGQANNIGISHALKEGADYVFLLNQDAYLQKDCVEKLIEAQKKHPEYGILSPIHLNGNGSRLDRNFSNYVSYNFNPDFYSDYILQKEKRKVYEVPFVNAAGWLISKNCLETVGGFDPIFKHYGEDDNYCQRLRYHGLKIGVVPNIFIQHDREHRESKAFLNKEAHLKRQERLIKIRYANINEDNLFEIPNKIRKRKKAKLKSLCKLKLSAVRYYTEEISLLKKVSDEIIKSREINKNAGLNHL